VATTNLETILDALADALEAVTPDSRATTLFARWPGIQPVEQLPPALRERAFQFRLGAARRPRTISTNTKTWHRHELQLVIGYNQDGDIHGDSTNNLGQQWLPMADTKKVLQTLAFGNPLSGVSDVKRMVYTGSTIGPASRTFLFDLEWAE
jgi:hypothetical protein